MSNNSLFRSLKKVTDGKNAHYQVSLVDLDAYHGELQTLALCSLIY